MYFTIICYNYVPLLACTSFHVRYDLILQMLVSVHRIENTLKNLAHLFVAKMTAYEQIKYTS